MLPPKAAKAFTPKPKAKLKGAKPAGKPTTPPGPPAPAPGNSKPVLKAGASAMLKGLAKK